ncbi:MAG: BAX inhibitor (BI)-1/YccA family protein [Bacteroidetes bacterium]|nr:MAG: BAX inhibitor (BI)-1/YccA family protein [Bacteroidota bacterium]
MNTLNKGFNYVEEGKETYPLATTFMSGVFLWMFLALAMSAATAWLFASNTELMSMLYNMETGGMSLFGWIVMLAPLGLVIWMSAGFRRMSASTMVLVFILFAVLLGASLSSIFLLYTSASIAKTFLITAGMFGTMAVVGYTTKTDLTKFGSLMFMGLIGIIIASVVNMFLRSGTMDYIISFIGVLVFTGLTAYDVQKLKRIGSQVTAGSEAARKVTIMGALTLYLDFINLFLFLLRFFGNRK